MPGPLRPSTDHAVEALELRVGGMQGLLDTFKATKDDDSKNATTAGEKLAEQARRLDASDVVWQVLFRAPAQATMQDEGVGDVTAPASVFVENVELYSARSMTAIWLRIHGASTGGTPSGVHGTGLEKVVVQPAGTQLAPDTETTIKASTDLAFDVSVKNTGDNQEVSIEVTLTIPEGHDADREEADDRHPRHRRDQDGHVQGLPRPAVRREDVRAGEREAGAGRAEHGEQQRRVPRHLLARVMDAALAVAIAACAVAVVALLVVSCSSRAACAGCRAAQKAVLGGASHDMVDFAVSLQGRIDDLHRAVDEVATGLSRVDRRVDGAITNTAVVRYDAYEDTGGKQSASFAFLDATRTGTVVTAIQGRDYARIYVKDVERGTASVALSPGGADGRRAGHGAAERAPPGRCLSASTGDESGPLCRQLAGTLAARASGTRPERKLRAAQRVLRPARARPRVEGQGRGRRAPRSAAAVGRALVRASARDPPAPVRPRAAGGEAADLAPGALRP